MVASFLSSILGAADKVTNVGLVTCEGGHKATHALLQLAGSSDFLIKAHASQTKNM